MRSAARSPSCLLPLPVLEGRTRAAAEGVAQARRARSNSATYAVRPRVTARLEID